MRRYNPSVIAFVDKTSLKIRKRHRQLPGCFSNIHNKSLIEVLSSPLFKEYRSRQPISNHLRPCPLLDNPLKLPEIVEAAKAVSTDIAAPEDVHELAEKCQDKARVWATVADEIWSGKQKK